MVWCVSYSNLETEDWSLYKCGGEGVIKELKSAILFIFSLFFPTGLEQNVSTVWE